MNDLQHLPPLLLPAPRLLVDSRDSAGWLTVPATVRINGYPPYIALATAILADHLHLAESTLADFGPLCVDGDPPEPALSGGEAYRLRIDARRIHLAAHSEAGMRHGLRTLAQLIIQYGRRRLPCVLIEDAPVFAVRGVMLDVSRDRVPTMAHLLETVDQLARWKINHLQLYTEHTFAYAGHEEVWRGASPLTADEMLTLDVHCRAHGIELAANQNCFGHLAAWLKHPRYAPLGEIAPDAEWDFNGLVMRRGPFSLCPSDPRALALVEDLLDQLLPTVAGPLVNIGCDETFDVGQGRSKDAVASRGRAAVYLEFVRAICAVVRRHGKRPMFWADIALEHPEALAELPADLIGLAWGYEPDAPFARWCQQLRAAGREVWVCPGTSCWRAITGRTRERRANLLAAARDGAAHGATGYLATAWGDVGHRQQWPITLHALAEAAHRAWSGSAEYDVRAGSLHAFSDRTLMVGAWLDELGDVDAGLRAIAGKPQADGQPRALRNASALFTDTQKPLAEPWKGSRGDWEEVAERLEGLAARQPQLPSNLHNQELLFSCLDASFAATRAFLRRFSQPVMMEGLLPELRLFAEADLPLYRYLWRQRSRPGGLAASCAHYRALLTELGPLDELDLLDAVDDPAS